MTSTAKTAGRNAPCPCGSGKKFKRCCEGKHLIARSSWAWKVAGLLLAAALVIVAIVVINADAWKSDDASSPVATSTSGQTPAPWEYDPVTDRHWNPEHGHWDSGPPSAQPIDFFAGQGQPAAAGTGTGASGTTPTPWQYDPQTDRHWNPQHGHWHSGSPPPVSQRTTP